MESLDSVKKLYSLAKTGKKIAEEAIKIAKAKKENPTEMKKTNPLVKILAAVAGAAVLAGIIFLVWKYLHPDYLNESDEDDFEDDFFDDDDDDNEASGETEPGKEEEETGGDAENAGSDE